VDLIAEDLARYLSEHPHAADTFDGIRRWWLTRIRVEEADIQVRKALEKLVDDRLVVKNELPDGRVLYRSAQRPTPNLEPPEPD
jgi:hypothetical protein